MTLPDLKDKKIAFLGLGVNHRHLAQYLKIHHIPFTVIDNWKKPEELTEKLADFDLVFRTPGLPFLSEPIQKAKSRGTVIYSQTKLFFDLCPARIIGVTGTKGKGTTTTLIHEILQKAGFKSWLAGNIGQDPFEFLDELDVQDWVVLELSSFQLQDLEKSPHIAVVLKITPEHLDHHQTLQEYIDAKTSAVSFQSSEDFTVLNYDSEITRSFADKTKGKILWNSIKQQVREGCWVQGDAIVLTMTGRDREVIKTSQVALIGRFNLENVTAALAACAAAGIEDFAAAKLAIMEFKGLEHRLEFVAEIKGVRFYNDSFSTTPDTAAAAISAFDAPIVLIAGGSEKNADYHELAAKIAQSRVKSLIAIGITGPKIAQLARQAGFGGKIYDTGLSDMEQIVAKANQIADPGDVVLLSPASASFDMFDNYKHRGELFKKYVNKLTG